MILDGKALALDIEKELTQKIGKLPKKPKLSIVLVGDNVASSTYVKMKRIVGERIGMEVEVIEKPESVSLDELKTIVTKLCNSQTDGVMLQLPVPGKTREQVEEVLSLISEDKDVDGLNPATLEKTLIGSQTFLPATVCGIERLLQEAKVTPLTSIAVVGSNGMVGRPLVDRLKFLGFRVAKFDLGDSLARLVRFDVIISCTGKKGLVDGEMVKEGVVAIDVGFPYGDFDFATVSPKASWITPVPGGVGPMTVICLMENVVDSFSS